ncbi:MAG: nucleoside deaminase [Phycisphaerae bacterium]
MTNSMDQTSQGNRDGLAALMRLAIDVAKQGIEQGQSPFGAVLADSDGRIVAIEHNQVRQTHDSTAHAEIAAIRAACRKLGTPNLTGHVIATTCEPCPMCAAAIHWARLDKVIYGASIADAKQAHFNELSVSTEALLRDGQSLVQIIPFVLREQCRALFELWKAGPNPVPY